MAHAGFPNGIGTDVRQVIGSLEKDTEAGRRLMIELNSVAIGEMNDRTVSDSVGEIGIK